jgi:hypothetical protein
MDLHVHVSYLHVQMSHYSVHLPGKADGRRMRTSRPWIRAPITSSG